MVYDEKISENVSLSKILDCYIEQNETCNNIIKFLKLYDKNFDDIAKHSLFIDRLYQYNYIKDCNINDIIYLIEHLEDIDEYIASNFVWQCLRAQICDTLKVHMSKYVYSHIKDNTLLKHPYSGYGATVLQNFDKELLEYGFCPELIFDSMSTDDTQEVLSKIGNSLFANRIYQYDCFSSCSPAIQYLMIKNLDNIPPIVAFKFVKQVLMSNEKPEIKYELYRKYCNHIVNYKNLFIVNTDRSRIRQLFDIDDDLLNLLNNANSYPSIAIHMQMYGEDCITDAFFWLLYMNRLLILEEAVKYDNETLEKYFPIQNLIEYIKNNSMQFSTMTHAKNKKTK